MTVMVVTVLLVMMVVIPVDQKLVHHVNMILPIMDLNAVIQPGMHLVLTVLLLKAIMAGIAVVVHVLVMQLVMMVVANLLVKIKDYGIVAMANVFLQVMFVMDHLNSVTQAGVLTVLMAQMKA